MGEASLFSSTRTVPRAWLPDVVGRPWNLLPGRAFSAGQRPATGRNGPLHVLFVEDDTSIAEMYRVQLEYDGYHVTLVPTGRAALGVIGNSVPDIILLDLLLPDRSGLEVLLELKQAFPNHPPVVILSNYGEPAMIERGIALGAVDYLVKSRVTPDSVSRAIPDWIGRGRSGETPEQQ